MRSPRPASTRCGIICRRFEAFSGDAAVLAGAGRSYEEIAAGREAAAA
jgi:hypothetical protein